MPGRGRIQRPTATLMHLIAVTYTPVPALYRQCVSKQEIQPEERLLDTLSSLGASEGLSMAAPDSGFPTE